MVGRRIRAFLAGIVFLGVMNSPVFAQVLPALIYKTGFEATEGFDPEFTLAGQGGWVSEGTGDNGLLLDARGFEGFGQQAYIGFNPPTDTNEFTSIWRPINYHPIPAGVKVVSFGVTMQIVDSTNGRYDIFRWSAYNQEGNRLFSIEFDNFTLQINYILQDATNRYSEFNFELGAIYNLDVYMNFERNLWSAYLNGIVILNSMPITLGNSPLNFGDMDAVWFVRNTARPGNNYMVFDDYTVVAEDLEALPSMVTDLIILENGNAEFIAYAEEGRTYVVEVTDDLVNWFPAVEDEYLIAPEGGAFLYEDPTSNEYSHGFYRLRLVE